MIFIPDSKKSCHTIVTGILLFNPVPWSLLPSLTSFLSPHNPSALDKAFPLYVSTVVSERIIQNLPQLAQMVSLTPHHKPDTQLAFLYH